MTFLVAAFFFWRNQKRSKRFVRAVDYLRMLDAGSAIEEANSMSSLLLSKQSDPDTDNRAINTAIAFCDAQFGGKQLPIIKLAKQKGFEG